MIKNIDKKVSPCCGVRALISSSKSETEFWRCTKCFKLNKYKIITNE